MVRAPTEKEYGQWKIALESQTADNSKATYVTPVLKSMPHKSKVSQTKKTTTKKQTDKHAQCLALCVFLDHCRDTVSADSDPGLCAQRSL